MPYLFREKELIKLREAYEMLDSRGFQIRFIVGKTGMGKTVLVEHFLEEIEAQDEDVLVTGCSCTLVGGEYQPFKDILQEMIREVGIIRGNKRNRKEKWKRVFGASADVLLKVAPDLIGDFVPLGGLINTIGEKVVEESGLRKKIEMLKNGDPLLPDLLKLTDQYLEILKLVAGQYRLIVYIDNLQWADRSSLELLQRLQNGLRRLPVMLIACYRSTGLVFGAGEERHPLEAFVTHAQVNCGEVFIDLDARNEKERREWTEHLLALEKINEDGYFLNRLYRKTGGNPLYIRELIREMKENGRLEGNEQQGWQIALPVDWDMFPVRIEGVIREEVVALRTEQTEILACAAVQGQKFWLPVLSRITGIEEKELLNWMTDELGRQKHLVYEGECFRLEGKLMTSFCFSDSFLRDYLYKGLGGARRMMLHWQVAEALEELYVGKLDEVGYELAWHYEQSGEIQQALTYLEYSFVKAESEMDYRKGVECAERALKLEDADLYLWRWRKLKAMRMSGNYEGKILLKFYNSYSPEEEEEEWKKELWHILMLEGKFRQAMKIAESMENGKGCRGVTAFWLGDFRLCKEMLEGEERVFYQALTAFFCGEYEQAERFYQNLARVCGKGCQERLVVALLGVWLSFLDDDVERMKEELKRVADLRNRLGVNRLTSWLEWFEAVVSAESEIWRGLERIEQQYEKMHDKRGVTLWGMAVCRICLKKRLVDVFDRWWGKIVQLAALTGEKNHLGELYWLKKRRCEISGKKGDALEVENQIKEWMQETGGKILML